MRLCEPIEAKKVERNYDPLPNGFYKVVVTKSEDYEGRESRKNPGTFFSGVSITMTVTGEANPTSGAIEHSKYEGRLIFDNVMLFAKDQYGNDSTADGIKKAVAINRDRFGDYLYSAGIKNAVDTEALIGGEFVVKIKTNEPKDGGKSYTNVVSSSRVSDYKTDNTTISNPEPVIQTLNDGEDDGDLPF